MRGGRLAAVALVALTASSAACSRDDGGETATRRTPPASTTTTSEGPAAADDVAPTEDSPSTTTMADQFAAVTTEAPAPRVALELRLTGAVSGTATGDVAARCLRGSGYLDIDIVAEPPLPIGQFGVTSLVFSAPRYRGPGRYDASAADDEEWAVALVDLETDEPLEFYAPGTGVDGSVTIDDGGKSGTFDIRGLVDDEQRSVAVAGRFTCGAVEG